MLRITISKYLKDPDNYDCTKHSGRIPTADQRRDHAIRHLAANKNMSYRLIKAELGRNVTRRHVQELRKEYIGLRYEHKNARIGFAGKYKFWVEEFANIIRVVEKKFNLDGPDGHHKYWSRLTYYKHNHGWSLENHIIRRSDKTTLPFTASIVRLKTNFFQSRE